MAMRRTEPLVIVDKGRDVPNDCVVGITDADGNDLNELARIEIVVQNFALSKFTLNFFPPSFDKRLLPQILRRAADRIDLDNVSFEYKQLPAERGEVVKLSGLGHVNVGIVPGHLFPTLVSDWTSPDAQKVPLLAVSAGPDKSPMWSNMIDANRPHIKFGVKELYGTAKGRKCIISGSGASLQVERLKKGVPDDWDIIACNDSYRLLDGNTKYAFFMEAQANPKWWSKIGRKTTLINSIYSHKDIAKERWNATYWFAAYPPKQNVPENNELIPTLGGLHEQLNCSMSAFHLAYLMGYQTIAFVGCDFAYTNGQSHYGEEAKNRDVVYTVGTDVHGGTVLSDEMLSLMARCHEAGAYWVSRSGVEVVNCTEGGIMTGMSCKPLSELIGEAK